MSSGSSKFDLKDKVAVVTGCKGNIGPLWCSCLLKYGAKVVGIDRPGSATCDNYDKVKSEATADNLLYFEADVTQRDSLEKVRDEIVAKLGKIDILVNSAGVDTPPKPGESYELKDWPESMVRHVVDVNLVGAMMSMQVFGGAMLEAKSGSIINIGSLYASVSPDVRMYDHIEMDPPFIKPPAYAASKAGLLQLTKYFAAHWGPNNVRVNALSPGGVLGGQDENFLSKFTSRVPLGRMGVDDDLEGPLIFLASDASLYVTGINLQVDGGFTVW